MTAITAIPPRDPSLPRNEKPRSDTIEGTNEIRQEERRTDQRPRTFVFPEPVDIGPTALALMTGRGLLVDVVC